MPFLDAAKKHVNSLTPGSTERLILEFLLKNGVGHQNAQPWSVIETYLKKNGVFIRQQTSQQGLLKQSRSGDFFIGSNDHDPGRGYFLIQEKEDAELIQRWYTRRIEVEQVHLDHLQDLMRKQWP
jgi:hypothetical protein